MREKIRNYFKNNMATIALGLASTNMSSNVPYEMIEAANKEMRRNASSSKNVTYKNQAVTA